MVQNVRRVDAKLQALRLAETERLACARIETPVSEVFEVAEAEVADFSRFAVFQQHFAWRSIRVTSGNSHKSANRLKIRAHPVASRDLRAVHALRIDGAGVCVPIQRA